MLKTALIILFLLPAGIYTTRAQQQAVVKDTSFSIMGTYKSEVKTRPYITIAMPVQDKNVLVQKDVVYRRPGQRQLLADVFYPRNVKKPKPAVLLIFGGGWRSGDKTHNHAMAATLAQNGYVAVSAEYRLSLEAKYPAAVYDLKAAVRWMRANARTYGIDTAKIAVLGCSAGGQLASLTGTTNGDKNFEDTIGYSHYSSLVQAVVNIDGSLAFYHPEGREGAASEQWIGYPVKENPEIWKQASPLTHVGATTPPFIFLNSSISIFHAGEKDVIRKLDSLGIYHEEYTFKDTPHPFWFFNPWFTPMMQDMVQFLNNQFRYKK